MTGRINYSGLVIAGLGFFLTRFTVTLVLSDDPLRFYLAGVVPLVLGLGLAAFGVALVVADVDRDLVRTTVRWCVIGTSTMLVLVVLTLLGSGREGLTSLTTVRSQTYLSNFLIGGSIGGTLTGLYAARTRRQHRELRQQTNRLEVLHRLLRHEILNSINVIRGHAPLAGAGDQDASETITRHSDAIERTVEEVRYLTRTAAPTDASPPRVDLERCLRASVAAVSDRHPSVDVQVDGVPADVTVRANERLEQVFTHLLENAIVHNPTDSPGVDVTVSATPTRVRVSVSDDGPGLPSPQRALLENGEITEYDDPRDGYGLNVVRLLVESFDGEIDTERTDGGTTITVSLPRGTTRETGIAPSRDGLAGVRLDVPHLAVTVGAALLAGGVYGLLAEQLGGSVAAIGVFYGIEDPLVGWLTHEFHSAVFAFAFAGFVSFLPVRYRNRVPAHVVVGIGWSLCLWVLAAGIVAPVWLLLLGHSVSIPNLSTLLLATHLAWGVSLGVLTAVGYRYVTPRLARRLDDVRG